MRDPDWISAMMFSVCGIIGLISYGPQLIKTIIRKKSDDISVTSYIMWMVVYISTSIYAWFYTEDIFFFVTYVLEGSACLSTLIVCLIYKREKGNGRKFEDQSQTNTIYNR